ncbi:DUF3040 domain-containing protein [Pseudonocardia sp. RS010]|uniref:DUF3040 domain-containing protein n=1 Tax=Pseudonocardia sp. RS010 TaxID=3385979 RepID=UPI00399F7490
MPTASPPPSPPPPEPDPARPLTEREKQVLAQLGSDLQASDPTLGDRLSTDPASARPRWLTVDRAVQTLVVLVVLLVLLPAEWLGLVLVLLLMVGLPLFLLLLADPKIRSWVGLAGRGSRRRREPDP